jgi:molybdopterin-synthase adenylyltransferase
VTDFSDEELDRYARHIVLRDIGGTGQARLKAARVTIIGAGGIGCPATQYLSAAGVGSLRIVDDDVVSLSNLQRQTLYGTADVGQPKVAVAARRITELNPHVAVDTRKERVSADNVAALIADSDVILDGTDNFATRLLISDAATAARIPLVSAAIGQFQGQVATFRGWKPALPCYRCFVGDAHDPDDCDDCATQGVLGAMVGMVGAFAAMEVVRAITGFGTDAAGKLHIVDGLAPGWRTVKLPKDAGCSACGLPARTIDMDAG